MLLALGRACLDQNDAAAASPPLERLTARDPKAGEALALLGGIAVAEDRLAEAEPLLRRAVALAPGSFEAHYQLSVCLTRAGLEAEAAKFRARADQITTNRDRILALSAETLTRPNDPALRHELGALCLRCGAEQVGRNWLLCALDIDPNHEPARRALDESRRR